MFFYIKWWANKYFLSSTPLQLQCLPSYSSRLSKAKRFGIDRRLRKRSYPFPLRSGYPFTYVRPVPARLYLRLCLIAHFGLVKSIINKKRSSGQALNKLIKRSTWARAYLFIRRNCLAWASYSNNEFPPPPFHYAIFPFLANNGGFSRSTSALQGGKDYEGVSPIQQRETINAYQYSTTKLNTRIENPSQNNYLIYSVLLINNTKFYNSYKSEGNLFARHLLLRQIKRKPTCYERGDLLETY